MPPISQDSPTAARRLIGMLRSPRATLAGVVDAPRSLDLAVLIVAIAAAFSTAFLLTGVGRLAALDQQVRQLEAAGTEVTDGIYDGLRAQARYRPIIGAAGIVAGWPVLWLSAAALLRAIGNRVGGVKATFAQVLTVVVHASAVFALQAVVAAPLNYARESLGGATSVAMLLGGLGDATFAARLLWAIDLFVIWWILLAAVGLGMLYRARTAPIARWLFGAYAAGAAAIVLAQVLRGGV